MTDWPVPGGGMMFDVMRIISALDKAKSPAFEATLRRIVPSTEQVHAARRASVRRVASEWIEGHPNASEEEISGLAEALWSTGWREERLVALNLIESDIGVVAALDFDALRRLALEVDNWELIDRLGRIGGRLLQMKPRLLARVEAYAGSDNPLIRRLGIVTLIEGADDLTWQGALMAMIDRLKADEDPQVQKAVERARRTLKHRGARIV